MIHYIWGNILIFIYKSIKAILGLWVFELLYEDEQGFSSFFSGKIFDDFASEGLLNCKKLK